MMPKRILAVAFFAVCAVSHAEDRVPTVVLPSGKRAAPPPLQLPLRPPTIVDPNIQQARGLVPAMAGAIMMPGVNPAPTPAAPSPVLPNPQNRPAPKLLPPPSENMPALWPKTPLPTPSIVPPTAIQMPSVTPAITPPVQPPIQPPVRPSDLPKAPQALPLAPPVLPLQDVQSRNTLNSSGPIVPPNVPIVPKPLPDPLSVGVPTPPPPTVGQLTALRSTPGDTPMLLPISLRRTALAAVLGTAFATGQLLADEPMKPAEVVTKADLKAIQESLDLLRKEIGELKTKEVGELRKDIADMKAKDLTEVRKELDAMREFKKQTQTTLEGADKGSPDGLVKKINSLDEKLSSLEKQLTGIDNKLSETVRVALKATEEKKVAEKTGTIKIVNMYATPIDVLINGKGYTVKSNDSKELTMAVGTFTYQLLTSGGEETKRAIKDGEVVTLLVK